MRTSVRKNKWMQDVSEDELQFLMRLPYSIAVPSLDALIVHAGVIPGVAVEDMSPGDLVSMRNVIAEDGVFRASRESRGGDCVGQVLVRSSARVLRSRRKAPSATRSACHWTGHWLRVRQKPDRSLHKGVRERGSLFRSEQRMYIRKWRMAIKAFYFIR